MRGVEFALRIDTVEPLRGVVRHPTGTTPDETAFTGWLELLAALEAALERQHRASGADPP